VSRAVHAQDAVILGRRSYDEWAEFWPGSDIQPFASFINAVLRHTAVALWIAAGANPKKVSVRAGTPR
jgi:dihydrofolate reductase